MSDQFINPITLSFRLLEGYRHLLRDSLTNQGLVPIDVEKILSTVQIDRGLYFSINRKYKQEQTSFAQFCRDIRLSDVISTCFPYIDHLFTHQEKAIRSILNGEHTIVSTGTGSGKTETFLIPIIDHCLKNPGPGVKAVIIYPMNALANDQVRRLAKALDGKSTRFGIFVGSTPDNADKEIVPPLSENHVVYRDEIRSHPPDILITNYVMLDWMLTRPIDLSIFEQSSESIRYIVLDEIHTYRGNKATHLKYLLARFKATLTGPVVQIGTSATLRRKTAHESYIKADDVEQIDAFIKPLLDVDQYWLVEPDYELEPEYKTTPIPEAVYEAESKLDWAMEVDHEAGLSSLELLTGEQISPVDLYVDSLTESKVFQCLLSNEFIVKMRRTLIDKNAQNFTDLVRLLMSMIPADKTVKDPERIVKAYLSAVSFINHLSGSEPILDYRIHLFLRNISGYLKMCIKCHRYHSGVQEFCQDCGFPLFLVYREDINQCIGKVSGNRLRWVLGPESDDQKNPVYVLISLGDSQDPDMDDLGFDSHVTITQEEMILNYDPYGMLRLTHLPHITHKNVLEEAILLLDYKDDHEYLYQLVKSILRSSPAREKKVLGFVDNREKASQYGMVIRQEFAEDFFFEYLKLHYPTERQLNLVDTIQYLQDQIPSEDDLSPLEIELFQELELWYTRMVKTLIRSDLRKIEFLALRNPDEFSSFEKELLEIFIRERAINMRYSGPEHGKHIRFRTFPAMHNKGIHCHPSQRSDIPDFPSISLGEDAIEYSEFIQEHGAESVLRIIHSLVERGVLEERQTSEDKTLFYINPTWICFTLPSSEFENYWEMRAENKLTAAVHSSEIRDAERKEVEGGFQDGEINFVMATPTLEMGIDIGELQTVVMVGVPPLPSNYAQRAGRAGRKRGNNFALIISFCFEHNNHDNYYFHEPKKMIDGIISPPSFNPCNYEVIRKHANAYMLAGRQLSKRALLDVLEHDLLKFNQRDTQFHRIFGRQPDLERYLQNEYENALRTEIIRQGKTGRGSLQWQFYSDGFFPDYSFRRDQIFIVPEGTMEKYPSIELEGISSMEDIAISQREPEIACYKFSPNENIFMAGDVYQITSIGYHHEVVYDSQRKARSYDFFEASVKGGHAVKRKYFNKYRISRSFDNRVTYLNKKGVINLAYHPDCRLVFVNHGLRKKGEIAKFSDEDGQYTIGYELHRQSIILGFDKHICAHETLYLSLVSALDRTIKDHYGLDDSEMSILVDPKPIIQDEDTTNDTYVVIYDATGSGNVPLERIFKDFDQIVNVAFQKLSSCKGGDQLGCEKGCYACLKSYGLHYHAHSIDKPTALMFSGYLLGKNKFIPSIAEPESDPSHYDLNFTMNIRGKEVAVKSGKDTYRTQVKDSQNKAIFDLLIKAILTEFTDDMSSLKITSNLGYIVNAIERGNIEKDKENFARLQFNLLRFRKVMAQKGSS